MRPAACGKAIYDYVPIRIELCGDEKGRSKVALIATTMHRHLAAQLPLYAVCRTSPGMRMIHHYLLNVPSFDKADEIGVDEFSPTRADALNSTRTAISLRGLHTRKFFIVLLSRCSSRCSGLFQDISMALVRLVID